jgi:hypothetical protein
LFTWLFGKKEDQALAPRAAERPSPTGVSGSGNGAECCAQQHPAVEVKPGKQTPLSEAENLNRWKASGQPKAWVVAHHGQWNHDDWLALLDELRRSPYWPMKPDEIGRVLEETRRQWQQRN